VFCAGSQVSSLITARDILFSDLLEKGASHPKFEEKKLICQQIQEVVRSYGRTDGHGFIDSISDAD